MSRMSDLSADIQRVATYSMGLDKARRERYVNELANDLIIAADRPLARADAERFARLAIQFCADRDQRR